jgi:threonine dehydrogenase-like Zn-dependent dehydrogenase
MHDTSTTLSSAASQVTMRTLVVTAPGRIRIEDAPLPVPGEGEVRIRLEGSGVCGSSLPVWSGRPWFSYPLEPGAPGHEGWGRVDAVGPDVQGPRLGERVSALGTLAHASHAVVPADATVTLPEELDGVPFPGEPLGCAMNVFERSEVEPGQTVAVIGIGFLGALLVQLAVSAGARVIAIARRPYALTVARRLGAEEAIAFDDMGAIAERVAALTDGKGCARVIEAVGTQEPLTLAGRLTAVRGRLVVAGFHQDGSREIDMQRWNWHGLDVINAHERDPKRYVHGMRAAVGAVVAGKLDPLPLYTHTLPLERAGEAYDLVRDRPDGFLKALVTT